MGTFISKDEELTRIGRSVRPDARQRVSLPKALVKEGITYHIYCNKLGQIVLDPQVTIPASEAWLFENKEVLASIDRGMVESANGLTMDRGSFAEYTEDAS